MKAKLMSEAIINARGTPRKLLGVSINSIRSRIPDINAIAKRKPTPAKKPWKILNRKLLGNTVVPLKNTSELRTAAPRTAQLTVIKGK